jgi:uncharacterized protein YndB with AHSA1/START domain
MKKLAIINTIDINAPIEQVWEALVNPEFTAEYMFGCVPLTDWEIGSPLLWEGKHEGQSMIFVKGTILKFQPHHLLEYTVIDPNNAAIPDIPKNYLTVTYELVEANGVTTFKVTQGDYNTVAEGRKRYQDSAKLGGWQSILEVIKELSEEEEEEDNE